VADQVSQVKISDASQPSDSYTFVTVSWGLGSVRPTKREETMFDLLFVGNPAIDDAIAEPDDMPQSLIARLRGATLKTLEKTYQLAIESQAQAIALCGSILNPTRVSPAQLIAFRQLILRAADHNCETLWVTTNPTDAQEYLRVLGEPKGLSFATPLNPWTKTIRSTTVELWAISNEADVDRVAALSSLEPLHRQILVGSDACHDGHHSVTSFLSSRHLSQPNTLAVWATKSTLSLPHHILPLPSIQSRCHTDSRNSGCYGLTFYRPPSAADNDSATKNKGAIDQWKQLPVSDVIWRTIRTESADEDHEGLSQLLWEACSSLVDDLVPEGDETITTARPLVIINCHIACGTSITRRLEVNEIAQETKRILRERCAAVAPHIWVESISADVEESLAALGRNRSGGRPGASSSFTSALADIVTETENASPVTSAEREAGWLALELLESE